MGREVAVWWGPDSILSALGFGTRENMEAVRAGRTNLSAWHDGTPVCQIDPERFAQLTAERAVAEYTPAERLALLTLGEVIARSGVSPANERTLVLLSTTKGNIGLLNGDPAKCDLNDTAEVVGRHFGAANRPLVISNACISGVSAIVVASRLIRSGEYDHVFVAGFDLLCDFIVSGFNAFKSVSPALCRPYDAARDGLTLGEAGGAVLLTTDRELSATGITVAGGGISNDANHISAPSRTGDGLAFAIGAALREASLGAAAIGMVNPHGTATLYNDEMESRALHLTGLCGTPCNSLKPYFGHTLGASGVIESIVTVHGLAEGTVFGVKGYAECGVPYPLNISAEHRTTRTDAALKTASGFGGCNAAAVFRRGTGRNAYGTDETGSTDENAAAERSDVFGGRYCDGENPARQDGTNGAETDRDDAQNKRRQETAGGQPGFTGADESSAAANVGQKECAAANGNNVITNAGQAGCSETERIHAAHDTAHVAITRHPEGPFGVYIGCRTESPFGVTLRLIPRKLRVGLGCRRGTEQAAIEAAVRQVFRENRLALAAISGVSSIDLKQDEPGLLAACRANCWQARFYSAAQLRAVPGSFTGSRFVASVTGVDNVCERGTLWRRAAAGAKTGAGRRDRRRRRGTLGGTLWVRYRSWASAPATLKI